MPLALAVNYIRGHKLAIIKEVSRSAQNRVYRVRDEKLLQKNFIVMVTLILATVLFS